MTEEEIKAMQDKITELTEANDKITKNRDDILGEKRNVQSAAAEKDAALKTLAEEKLKLAGDMDGLKSLYAKNNAESVAKLQDALDRERKTNQKADYDKEYNSNVYKQYLKGVDSSGADTTQSRSTGGVADTLEACKGDKTLEAAYFNKQLGN